MTKLNRFIYLILFIFSNEIHAAEQKEIEIPCNSLSAAIRETFKRIPSKTLQEIRPLYKNEDEKVMVAFSSRPSPEATISVYRCGLDKSSAYDKIVGFEYTKKGNPSDYIQFRLDWDEKKGGHINLQTGKENCSKKYAFKFPNITENAFRSQIKRLDKSDRNARDVVSILMGLSNIRGDHIRDLRGAQGKYLEAEIARQPDKPPPPSNGEDPYEQSGQWAENNLESQAEGEGT